MTRWEYNLVPLPSGTLRDIEQELDKFGIVGWELCMSEYGHLIFKRQILSNENESKNKNDN